MNTANRALATISLAVLLASATWFSGTAVATQLAAAWGLNESGAALLTTATQAGFLVGTLIYALWNLADRFDARRVFAASALVGAATNWAFGSLADGLSWALPLRFITGASLAGVYPVGMRLVASWSDGGLGWRLGVMVGALGLGTASPYLMRALEVDASPEALIGAASVAAVLGALLIQTIGTGPHLKSGARLDLSASWRVFRDRAFRLNAIGYFGHMWELYALWSLAPFWIAAVRPEWSSSNVAMLAFAIVGVGALGCVAGGAVSRAVGERRVALTALLFSASACLLSPLAPTLSDAAFVSFAVIWGLFVVADSPQFSALAARTCPPEYTGTALTIQNGVGYAITVVAIQLVASLADAVGWDWVLLTLAPGPLLGAWAMVRLRAQLR